MRVSELPFFQSSTFSRQVHLLERGLRILVVRHGGLSSYLGEELSPDGLNIDLGGRDDGLELLGLRGRQFVVAV